MFSIRTGVTGRNTGIGKRCRQSLLRAGCRPCFVDVFDTDGHLLRRFASRGPLNSPWGMTRTSFAFGRFSGQILIGNFGNGKINAFASHGRFLDELDRPNGSP